MMAKRLVFFIQKTVALNEQGKVMTWKEWFWEMGFNFEDRLAQPILWRYFIGAASLQNG